MILIHYLSSVEKVGKVHNGRGNPQNSYYLDDEDVVFVDEDSILTIEQYLEYEKIYPILLRKMSIYAIKYNRVSINRNRRRL